METTISEPRPTDLAELIGENIENPEYREAYFACLKRQYQVVGTLAVASQTKLG